MHKANKLDSIVFEKKESILDEIQQARKLAVEFAESVRQQKLQKINESKYNEHEAFHESREKFKSDLLGEFLQLAENTRGELFEYTEQKSEEAYNFIIESINDLSDKLSQSLEYGIQEQSAQFVTLFENRIAKLAQNILANKLLKEIESNNKLNNESIDVKFDTIFKSLTEILNEQVESTLSKYDKTILTLEQSNVELNNNIIKSSNKALSRIGNVKTQLEKSINDAELKIIDFYNNRITLIEQTVTDSSVENKKHFIKLIEESKQSILNEVSQIKTGVPLIVAEKTRGANGDIDVKLIKTDLEKTISNRFTQELANVRRLIEMSSGGGSVAVQFANGGTMNGNLNVVGDISTTGVIYNNNFNSNNWNNTYTSVSNTSANWNNVYTSVQANSANWDTGYNTATALNLSSGLWNDTYTTVSTSSANWDSAYNISTDYQTASSTFATIEYTNNTFFPLSGGTITGDTKVKFGDLTVFGDISATGDIYSNSQTIYGSADITGNVGIGTASTTYKLDVNGTANFVNNVTLLGTANESPNQTLSAGSSSILTKGLADTLYQPIVIFNRLENNASYTNDATGTVILSGNLTQGTYEMEAFIRSTVNATNSKISISCTDPTALIAGYRGAYNNGSSPSRIAGMASQAAGGPWGATSNSQNHERYGTLKINASTATLTINASQNTDSGTTTTFSADSYLRLRKII